MIVVYSFIGKLPPYIVDTVFQCRLFFSGPIFLILDDMESTHIEKLKSFNISLVDYQDVKSESFLQMALDNRHRFEDVPRLGDRRMLFMRTFERFFLLKNLMKLKNLENVFFLELDNMIYANPELFSEQFGRCSVAFMIDDIDRISTGIAFFKSHFSLDVILDSYIDFIKNSPPDQHINEMVANWRIHSQVEGLCILPTLSVACENSLPQMHENFKNFGVVFDAAAIGVFLLGSDPVHTGGVIKRGLKNPSSRIDYTGMKIQWETDVADGMRKPYIYNDNSNRIPIFNLHVHSKDLASGLSIIGQSKINN